jgi:hypothetical protein
VTYQCPKFCGQTGAKKWFIDFLKFFEIITLKAVNVIGKTLDFPGGIIYIHQIKIII